MLDVKKNTPFDTVSDRRTVRTPLHAHPSLLPLRMALTVAASEVPVSPPHMDANERRALQLIQKVKAGYKKPRPLFNWNDIPSQHGFCESLHGLAVTHA